MSFRVRVLLLVAIVAVTAVGATAYLTYAQANREVTRQVAADDRTAAEVIRALTDYAQRTGTWAGVESSAAAIADRTGQRVRLVADDGAVVVDSDVAEHGSAGPVTVPPIVVDARPILNLPAAEPDPLSATFDAIAAYRAGVRAAVCLREHGLDVVTDVSPYGIPVYSASETARRVDPAATAECQTPQPIAAETDADRAAVVACDDDPARTECLRRAFTSRTSGVAPGVLRLHLVAEEGMPAPLQPGPVIAAAAFVAVLALVGTVLVSRRVLRPIADVTAAAASLGGGELAHRVPVRGHDELAYLARSFNRMAESVQSSEERQRRLVADVAHELRTPLANLRGYLEALKDGILPGDPTLFAQLHREAVLQQRIVDDLQDLALAEAGALAYHPARVDLTELLETCRTAHQPSAESADVALTVQSGPSETPVTWADPDRLRQAVSNLIVNALHATARGGTVTLSADLESEAMARVTVADTGVGIPPDELPHIFDRFWRADASRDRATGGSGLGLSIARQIVIDHGGQITAESQPGIGTTMTIVLPTKGTA